MTRKRLTTFGKVLDVLTRTALVIEGITTNQTLQFYILHQPDYIKGHFNTSFIETHLDEMVSENG